MLARRLGLPGTVFFTSVALTCNLFSVGAIKHCTRPQSSLAASQTRIREILEPVKVRSSGGPSTSAYSNILGGDRVADASFSFWVENSCFQQANSGCKRHGCINVIIYDLYSR